MEMFNPDPIRFQIDTSIASSEQSPLITLQETINDMKWKFEVYRDENMFYVFRLECRGPSPASGNWLWSCNALCHFDVINHEPTTTYNYHRSISGVLNSCNAFSHHRMNDLPWDFSVRPLIDVELRIYVYRLWKRNLQIRNDPTDVELLVEERRHYVSRQLLRCHSAYFRREIQGNAGLPGHSLTINKLERRSFLSLLLFIYPTDIVVTSLNVKGYLQIAKSFECHAMTAACAEYLTLSDQSQEARGRTPLDLLTRLRLADEYNMPAVVQKIINELPAKQVVELSTVHNLSDGLKAAIQFRNWQSGYGMPSTDNLVRYVGVMPEVIDLD
ncbi:hypothetical protein L596_008893 [Steinernema carpocapsae]|uniref:BTB domain-containing protein n=1 Tax=Steinernema carpocapsae TaxID=34508 RepID=A0A4U5PEL8_STECR|nr:hypothetical protein L596_008893 [Steinernema carpocapsae]